MIKNEDLEKLKARANQAVDDQGSGVTITLAMDPVVVYAMVTELLRLRRLQRALEYAVEADHERRE